MKIQQSNAYDISSDALYAVFTDRAYYDAYYGRSEAEYEFVEFGARGGRFIVDVRRHVRLKPGAHVPALVKKFVREVNVLHLVMEWKQGENGVHHGTYRFEIEGMPVDIRGSTFIEPKGTGCVHRMDVNVTCGIPLIGGKIAAMAGERAEKSLTKDYEATLRYLREQGGKA